MRPKYKRKPGYRRNLKLIKKIKKKIKKCVIRYKFEYNINDTIVTLITTDNNGFPIDADIYINPVLSDCKFVHNEIILEEKNI